MDQTLNVKIAIQSSSAVSAMNTIKKSINGTNTSTEELNNNMAIFNSALAKSGLKLQGLKAISDVFKSIKDSISNMLPNLQKGLETFKSFVYETGKRIKIKSLITASDAGILSPEATQAVESGATSLKAAFAGLGSVLAVVAAAAAVVVAIFAKMALKCADLADKLDENSQKLNMTASAYEHWIYIFDRAGLSESDFSTMTKKMQQSVSEAATSGEYASSAYAKLGLSLEQVKNMSNGELLAQVTDRLKGVSDQTERTALATDIFGKSATSLNILLNQSGKELEYLNRAYSAIGGDTSTTLVKNSALLQDTISDLKIAWQGLKNELAEGIVPVLQKVIRGLTLAIAYVGAFISFLNGNIKNKTEDAATGTETAANSTKKATDAVGKNIDGAVSSAKELKKQLLGFDELNILSDMNTDSGISTDSSINDYDYSDIADAAISFDRVFTDEQLQRIENFKKKLAEIRDILDNNGISGLLGFIADKFNAAAESGGWFGEIVAATWQGVKDGWDEWVKPVLDKIAKHWEDLKGSLADLWDALKSQWNDFLAPLFAWIIGMAGVISEVVLSAIFYIVDVVQLEVKAIIEIITGIINFITGVFTGDWKQAWLGLKQICIGIFNAILGIFGLDLDDIMISMKATMAQIKMWWIWKAKPWLEGVVDSVVGFFDNIIDKIKEAVDWLKSFNEKYESTKTELGAEITINEHGNNGAIPKFASGGVLTTPTIGLMAEYSGAQSNPEIVTPQSIMAETVIEANEPLARTFAIVGEKIIEAINNKDSNVYIDKTKISREIYGSLQSEGTRRGTSAVSFI